METFNYKDDKFSIRPQAPPGGETHFNISDSEYGDKEIYHKHKRNNHPSNDINPPPNFVKKEEIIESTPNGAKPVTGNRPSIKLRAPPGGFSSLDYYAEETTQPTEEPITQEGVICNEPETKEQNPDNSKEETVGKKQPFRPVYTPQAPPGGKSSISFGYDDEPVNAPKPKPRTNSGFSQSSNDDYKPVYTPQAPPGGKSSISFGYDEPVDAPKPKPKPRANSGFSQSSSDSYKPVYTPQAPPGGKSSISFDEKPVVNRPKPRPNPEFQESGFGAEETTPAVRRNNRTKQNNQSTFGTSFFDSNDDNSQYKPYYAPQAPPGGKDSISLGFGCSETSSTTHTGRRRNYESDHFKGSNFTEKDNNEPYKPYYAPQAPPGGKDSISIGYDDSNNSSNNTPPTSFSGRRRNYNADHFKSSFGFNY
ncbi:hypothetical protein H8356DRAFT_1053289 [Neocallimastix lanati (nom. inval.)]|jgi:hypothetical protein|uniref:Uncharacterized protein n=1 Tax=Neocallimastix californiae TaxID=1754190 RepID=A0A1Y2ELT2_9FUNG|nr:hypothetical protein H8356DRAFT_1053289 [Neocallimastix sp. JGI-2020a]ORY72550.1 hypothetical protein LY90DRAFT_667137 [Neocallimastix californiae]|eukprot:ORY72550.1 hypothetical protein LY90DRAFT_667137 [Neocallimastix californiae]